MKENQILKIIYLFIFGGLVLSCADSNSQPSNSQINTTSAANKNSTNAVSSNTTNSERKKNEEEETVSRSSIGITLSNEAQEISDLLDNGKYSAANVLFEDYIPRKRNDAGLYCQYLRYLLAFEITSTDTTLNSTPLYSPDPNATYNIGSLAERTAQLAIEFAPETKSWVADTIFREMFKQIRKRAEINEGYIPVNRHLALWNNQYGNKKIFDTCFKAIEIDSEIAKKWVFSFEKLIPVFLKNGKAVSTMWTANLVGDMKTGAQGDQDFFDATNVLRRSIESGKSSNDNIYDAIELYLATFTDEVIKFNQTENTEYKGLLRAIENSKLIKAIEVDPNLDNYDRQSRISRIKTLPGLVVETTGNTNP